MVLKRDAAVVFFSLHCKRKVKWRWGSRNSPCLLGVKLLTCVTQVKCDERLAGALRTVCPDCIYQVFFDRHKIMSSTSQGFGHPLPLVCQRERRVTALKNTHWFNHSPMHRGQTQESESPPFLPASPSSHSLKNKAKAIAIRAPQTQSLQPAADTEPHGPEASHA